VICTPEGEVIEEIGKYIGETTNNVAEYEGLLLALQRAGELRIQRLIIFSDSQLLARQLNGQYRIRSEQLRSLYQRAQSLIQGFDCVTVTYIPRAENRRADQLANRAIEEQRQ
jgi:ribonuclease HI